MNAVLAITGASGAIYAVRLLEVLLANRCEVHLSISTSGAAVLEQELGVRVNLKNFATADLLRSNADDGKDLLAEALDEPGLISDAEPSLLHYHHYQDMMAPIASGSFLTGGMVVCPCSGTTLSSIARASAGNLIQRAAEVHMKERRPLLLVPRETPVSVLQLENMHRASQAGAIVLPASPGWYHGVRGLSDLVDFVVARICDQLRIEHKLTKRWGDDAADQ